LVVVFREFAARPADKRVPAKARYSLMFMLPTYDATAIAMLGFGILAAAALALGF
jgi:hypothetical protein